MNNFLISICLFFFSFLHRFSSSKSCKTFLLWPQKALIEVKHMQAPEHLLHPVELYSTSLVCLALQDHLASKAEVDSWELENHPLLWKRQRNTSTLNLYGPVLMEFVAHLKYILRVQPCYSKCYIWDFLNKNHIL